MNDVTAAGETAEHRLQLPRSTDPQDVLTMVRNVRPEARLEDGAILLGDGTRMVADEGRRGAGRWTLQAPISRETRDEGELPDARGYHRAFPEGVPSGSERDLLDLAWSLARRLDGAVVTADGIRLEPHPCSVRDLAVVSPYALAPESLIELLCAVEPTIVLDEVPEGVETAGYAATVDAQEAGLLIVEVSRSPRHTGLRELDWMDEAVEYVIRHEPVDDAEEDMDLPDPATAARWVEVYRRIGRLAAELHEAIGGYVLDAEGFLVDAEHLR